MMNFAIKMMNFAFKMMHLIDTNVQLNEVSQVYVAAVAAMPEMQEWIAAAHEESHRIAQYEK